MSSFTGIANCAIALPMEISQTVYGYTSGFILSFTMYRLLLACILLPLFLTMFTFRVIPYMIGNLVHLFSAGGREMLIRTTESYRKREEQQAQLQFEGKFEFPEQAVFQVKRIRKEWMGGDVPWQDDTEEFKVCGATVRYVHLRPAVDGDSGSTKRKIVFLHGNPSWSYMWRNVLPPLVRQGHEVYALDWLGHGRSDKIIRKELINFELHMRTLITFFEHTKLRNTVVVAHDWGGCIALCTIPHLPPSTCDGLFLLDSFFPPRPSEVSLHCALLYVIWYLSIGILRGAVPEWAVMRFMSPHLSLREIQAYGGPYRGLSCNAKSGVHRLSHMAPVTPRYVLRFVRETYLWKLVEGFLGPENFSDLNAQARLAGMDQDLRIFWKSRRPDKLNQGTEKRFKVAVVFGEKDPLLKDYLGVLVRGINRRYMIDWAPSGCWLKRAGHYPMEERPHEIVNLIWRFADH